MERGSEAEEFVLVEGGVDALQVLADRLNALFVERNAIHDAVVHLSYLIGNATGLVLLGSYTFDEFAELCVVVLCQLIETAETGVLGCQGMSFHPAAAGILIEIGAWKRGGVKVVDVNTSSEGGLLASA